MFVADGSHPSAVLFDTLTRAQHRVLAYLAEQRNAADIAARSSREIAQALGLSRRTVQNAVNKLNDLDCLRTWSGSRTSPSEHTVLQHFQLVPLGSGAITPDPCGNAESTGATEPTNAQGPGAIVPESHTYPQGAYKEGLTLPLPEGRADAEENAAVTYDEVLVFAERCMEQPLTRKLEKLWRQLAASVDVPTDALCEYICVKWRQCHRSPRFTPWALFEFVRKDVEEWWNEPACPVRKPPRSESCRAYAARA